MTEIETKAAELRHHEAGARRLRGELAELLRADVAAHVAGLEAAMPVIPSPPPPPPPPSPRPSEPPWQAATADATLLSPVDRISLAVARGDEEEAYGILREVWLAARRKRGIL